MHSRSARIKPTRTFEIDKARDEEVTLLAAESNRQNDATVHEEHGAQRFAKRSHHNTDVRFGKRCGIPKPAIDAIGNQQKVRRYVGANIERSIKPNRGIKIHSRLT